MSKNSKKDAVVRASDLALPKQLTEKHFINICSTFRIPLDARPAFRERLNSLVSESAKDMRKVDGWQTLATKPIDQPIDLAA